MAIFRTQFQRINFDFDPPLKQVSDVVFEVDADEYTDDNYGLFDAAAGKACGEQNPHWSNYESPIEGYAGWSSVLSGDEKGYTKVEDIGLDFDMGTPGEGLPRIAETFTDNSDDDVEFTHSWQRHSWRVSGFYKTYVPMVYENEQHQKQMEHVRELLEEVRQEELADMTASQRLREEQQIRVVQCSREEAEFVSGSGVAGCIRRLEDITITGRVNWEDRTIARARRDYKIIDDGYPTKFWMYWLAGK